MSSGGLFGGLFRGLTTGFTRAREEKTQQERFEKTLEERKAGRQSGEKIAMKQIEARKKEGEATREHQKGMQEKGMESREGIAYAQLDFNRDQAEKQLEMWKKGSAQTDKRISIQEKQLGFAQSQARKSEKAATIANEAARVYFGVTSVEGIDEITKDFMAKFKGVKKKDIPDDTLAQIGVMLELSSGLKKAIVDLEARGLSTSVAIAQVFGKVKGQTAYFEKRAELLKNINADEDLRKLFGKTNLGSKQLQKQHLGWIETESKKAASKAEIEELRKIRSRSGEEGGGIAAPKLSNEEMVKEIAENSSYTVSALMTHLAKYPPQQWAKLITGLYQKHVVSNE
jgi:hypothetical protein